MKNLFLVIITISTVGFWSCDNGNKSEIGNPKSMAPPQYNNLQTLKFKKITTKHTLFMS